MIQEHHAIAKNLIVLRRVSRTAGSPISGTTRPSLGKLVNGGVTSVEPWRD
jgi:hypothetical protein